MINGDGKAPPPTESEYEKIEIFSNSVPIDAYLKLKQMLVESDNRIQELLAANQDLKQEVSHLQNMVQALMEENVHLRRSGGSTGTAPGADVDSNSLGALASAFASSATWSPETQMRMAQFQRALMNETGAATSTSAIDFYAPSFNNAASSVDFDLTPTSRQPQPVWQQRSQNQRENNSSNNNNIGNPLNSNVFTRTDSSSSSGPHQTNGQSPYPPHAEEDNRFDTNRNHLPSLEEKNRNGVSSSSSAATSAIQQRLSRTSSDLDKVANTAFRLQPQNQQQLSSTTTTRLSSSTTTRDDSSIHTASTRGSARGFHPADEGVGGGRGHRNRPVSMFEPRLAMSRGVGAAGGVDHSQQRTGGAGGVEALQHPTVNDANVLNSSSSPHPGWINSYSARGEGPAGNVHQVRARARFCVKRGRGWISL